MICRLQSQTEASGGGWLLGERLFRAPGTHPDCAALVDPLFACGGKRVNHKFILFFS
jgi:hypothetical protein